MPPGALAPYRVLDLTGDLGALCARMLADLGADVIKVEPPGGDPARLIGPFIGGEPHQEKSLRWLFFNANKRGITLDIANAGGQATLRELVASADFLVESFTPGYLESIGLSYEALAAINPRLIGVSVTPFGSTGPYRHFKSSDLVAWAMGGHMELAGDADRPPLRVSYPQSWSLAGAHAAAGALMALAARRRTGLGQHVDVSAQEAVTWTLMIAAQTWDVSRVNPKRGGAVRTVTRPGADPLRTRVVWPCKDGYIYWGLAGGSQAGGVASIVALVDWMREQGGADGLADITWQGLTVAAFDQETYDRLTEPFRVFFLTRTKRELFEGAVARAIQLAPVNTLADHVESPQLAAREFFEAVEHPRLGVTLRFPGAPVKLGVTPWRIRRPAPGIGEHNAEVLASPLVSGEAPPARLEATGAL